MVTERDQTCVSGRDDVECEAQGELFSVDDVDSTARFVSHPAWSLFGDTLRQED